MTYLNSSHRNFIKKMKIKTKLFFTICCLFLLGGNTFSQTKNQPNILFIMTDQQSAEMMSCAGNKYLETPALDALAKRGTRFELAYSPNPVCVPSRTAMVTGQFPSAFHISDNLDANKAIVPEAILSQTMGKLLAEGGYDCVYGGKTHWAKGLNYESTGFRNLTTDHRDELANKCADYIKQKHDKPFLLVASIMNPHDICYYLLDRVAEQYDLPKMGAHSTADRETIAHALTLADQAKLAGTYDELCPPLRANSGFTENIPLPKGLNKQLSKVNPNASVGDKIRHYRDDFILNQMTEDDWRTHSWIYHRLMEDADRQIGIILNALKESGLEDNTIVVFTSDHGEMNGAHKKTTKTVFYDESARVPFLIAGPGIKKGAVDKKHLVSASLDLIPTFCEYAGVPIPDNLHGKSIKSVAAGEKVTDWRQYVISENGSGRMLRSGDYKYIYYKNGSEVLFDMRNDPGEMENLAVHPEYRKRMNGYKQQLKEWVQKTKDPVASAYLR